MKKKVIMIITSLLIVLGAYQGTKALFRDETTVNSPINAGRLGIEINDTSTNETLDNLNIGNIMPGSTVSKPIEILNSKDKDLYVRVTLTRYWSDQEGNKVTSANAAHIIPITDDTQDWLIIDDAENSNAEVLYYYYRLPLSAKEKTSKLLDRIYIDDKISDVAYSSYKANIKLEAEAIQKAGAQDAILSQWGMEVAIDPDGTILQVKE